MRVPTLCASRGTTRLRACRAIAKRRRDCGTTGPQDSRLREDQPAEYAEYAEKWSAFAYFVYSAVLWPFYFGRNAQFLATRCKKTAEGRGEMEEGKRQAVSGKRLGPPRPAPCAFRHALCAFSPVVL